MFEITAPLELIFALAVTAWVNVIESPTVIGDNPSNLPNEPVRPVTVPLELMFPLAVIALLTFIEPVKFKLPVISVAFIVPVSPLSPFGPFVLTWTTFVIPRVTITSILLLISKTLMLCF